MLARRMIATRTLFLLVLLVTACGCTSSHPHTQATTPIVLHTQDGATLQATLYGQGPHGVVLAHGGRFNKESWDPQARALSDHGFRVIAFDFRGVGQSHGPGDSDFFTPNRRYDVLAAARYLKENGATSVSIVGGSLGGGFAADAALDSPGTFDRIVFLSATPGGELERLGGRKLFIMARNDISGDGPRLPGFMAAYGKTAPPKQLILLDGSAHAQFLFQSDQSERVMGEILKFLSAP
jgi:pimeloyl-ACP methyl ester carboxylesterase